jgi:hypothetical protein
MQCYGHDPFTLQEHLISVCTRVLAYTSRT